MDKVMTKEEFIKWFGWKLILKRKELMMEQRNLDAQYYGKWQYAPITIEDAIQECYNDYLAVVNLPQGE